MYVIFGASGNTGGEIAKQLLAAHQKVRVVGRDSNKLQALTTKGADAAIGDLHDAEFLNRALAGAKAVYALIPPQYRAADFRAYQNAVGKLMADAIQKQGVKYVVHLSSVGADVPDGTGPIAGLHDQEQRLNAIKNVHVLHLRAAYFMENFLAGIGMIKTMGINGSAMKGDAKFAMIATRDIAAYATARLHKLDFQGQGVQYLLGERDLTVSEATRAIGKVIGKPDLPYVQFSYDQAQEGLTQMGLSPDVAKGFVEMSRAFNEGKIKVPKRDAKNTTPTSIETFAAELFAKAYGQQSN